MRRGLWRIVMSTALIAGVYFATMFFLGKQVEKEINLFADELIAHDSVRVARFDYERRLAAGVLHYDLVLLPAATGPAAGITSLLAALPPEGMPLSGSLNIDHGPWLGGGHGFGIAKTVKALPVPDALRRMLPQYPGQRPMLRVTAAMSLGGELRAVLEAVDYNGRFVAEGTAESIDLTIAGLQAVVQTNPAFEWVNVDVQLQEFRLADNDFAGPVELTARDLFAGADWRMSQPWVWTGISELSLAQFELLSPDNVIRIHDLQTENETRERDGYLSASNTVTLGNMSFNDVSVSDAEFVVSAGNINVEAYADLMAYANGQVAGGAAASEIEAGLDAALQQILADGPWLSLDRLSVSLMSQDDVLANGRITVSPFTDPEQIAEAVEMQSDIRVSTAALRQFARLYVQNTLDGVLADAELTQQADTMYNETVELLQLLGYVEISADYVSLQVALDEGQLLIGGEPLLDLAAWFAGLTDGIDSVFDPFAGSVATDISALNRLAEPLYERVELAAGFLPDPYQLDLVAGGSTLFNASDVNDDYCVGYLNAGQADVVINYTAGTSPMYVFVSAQEDTTLTIVDPAGQLHCNDDGPGLGLNPGLEFLSPLSGDYHVWIGTYDEDIADARLLVSEIGMGN